MLFWKVTQHTILKKYPILLAPMHGIHILRTSSTAICSFFILMIIHMLKMFIFFVYICACIIRLFQIIKFIQTSTLTCSESKEKLFNIFKFFLYKTIYVPQLQVLLEFNEYCFKSNLFQVLTQVRQIRRNSIISDFFQH